MQVLLITGLLLWLSACQQQEQDLLQATDASPVVATVNGKSLHESDIDAEMAALPDNLFQYRNDPKARAHMLRSLIRREAISQKANELGLALDPLIRKKIENVRRQILIEAAKEWRLSRLDEIPDKQIRTYYQQHLADFTVPEQVHARHILVGSEKQAWQILKQRRKPGADFAQLAARESMDDGNKSLGGDLNWFPRGVMVQAFDDVVFKLKKNGLSKPVKTRFGWHVIQLLGRRAESRKPLDEVRDEIISLLQHEQMQVWFQQIESSADINVLKAEYR